MKKLFNSKYRSMIISLGLTILAYVILQALIMTGNISSLFKSLLVPLTAYIVAAIGLNLNVGISGELNLGQAGFMSVGAFTAVIVSGFLEASVTNAFLRLFIAIIAAMLVTALIGYLISLPVLKLQGDYLAIVTLAFGQIIMSLINNTYLGFDDRGFQFSFAENKLDLNDTGRVLLSGPMGANGTTRIATFTAGFLLILVSLFIVYNLMDSKSGRAIMGARDNRIAAQSVGINITKTKTLAFVISSCLAGAGGALYALNYSTLVPAKFGFNTSILILVYVVLGGLGNMTGTLISTSVLFILPELLRSLQDYRMIIYAVVLILIMIVTNNPTLQTKLTSLKQSLLRKKGGPVNE